jgi:hypothetical protein
MLVQQGSPDKAAQLKVSRFDGRLRTGEPVLVFTAVSTRCNPSSGF